MSQRSNTASQVTDTAMQTMVVGIVGLGLIGGSIGLALRSNRPWRVIGYDLIEGVAARAVLVGACHEEAGSLRNLARRSDVVVVAVPSSAIPEVALLAAESMKPGSVVTDVGSVKLPVQERIIANLPPGVQYVGGHPMAGSERSGLEAASADLFRGAVWAITDSGTNLAGVERVGAIVEATGARPLVVDALEHDKTVSFTSHLPYLVALATALCSRQGATDLPLINVLTARGFRDTTRLARSDPSMAVDYCVLNNQSLLAAISSFEEHLATIKTALRAGNRVALVDAARRAREYLQEAPAPGGI
ncbi:MAG: prephenate dehydrogenase [Firmicutes bacterium]|nr:prephenate dehydrogenase [Bacillota bacterium]